MSNSTLGAPFGGTMYLNKAVISGVTSTGATTISTTPVGTSAAMEWMIGGKAYSVAAFSSTATPTTDINTSAAFVSVPANYGCVYVLLLNTSAALKVAQGPLVACDNAGTFASAPEFPSFNDLTHCPFGYIVVKTTSSNTGGWVFGTSNWNAAGVTATPVDVCMLPARPQVS